MQPRNYKQQTYEKDVAMQKGHGTIRKVCGELFDDELKKACEKLPDGEFDFLIVNHERNRKLPYTQYLFAVLFPYISQALPEHPNKTGIYKYFEDMFAPIHTCTINGEQFNYCDLKTEKIADVNDFIERVIEYSRQEWGIEIPTQDEISEPERRDFYSQAYLNQDADWSSVISSLRLSKDNERRRKETN